MRKIKKYKVNKDNSLMLAVSFVKNPAMESKFLALEEEKDKNKYIALDSDYKHMVYGAVCRPDFPVYRNDGKEEYYLEFDKEAIEVITEKYMAQGRTQNFTEAHKNDVDDITVMEVWLKADPTYDKSIALGLDPKLEVGTLFFGAKVNNDDVWQKVLDGTYAGFSLEAIVGIDEMDFEEQTPAPEVPAEPAPEAPKAEEPKEEETKEKGILAKIMDLINGKPIEEVVKPAEEPKKEEPAEEKVEEKPEEPKEEEKKDEFNYNEMNETIQNLKSELEALKEKNKLLEGEKEKLTKKVDDMGKAPSTKPVNTNAKGEVAEKEGVKNTNYLNWRKQVESYIS